MTAAAAAPMRQQEGEPRTTALAGEAGEDGRLVLEGGRDAVPEVLGRAGRGVHDGVAQQRRDVTVRGQLGATTRAGDEMLVDRLALFGVESVEGIGAEQLLQLVVGHGCSPARPRPEISELAVHALEAATDPALHGPLGLAEDRGHLPVGVAAKIGELDRLALVVGKAAEDLAHLVGNDDVADLALEVVTTARGLPRLALLPASARLLCPHQVHGAAVGLGEQVRPEGPPLGVEAVGRVPEPHEHLLHYLFGRRLVAQQPLGQAEDGSGMATVDLGERVLPVARDGEREVGVARVGQFRSHLTWTTEPARRRMSPAHAGRPQAGRAGLGGLFAVGGVGAGRDPAR